MNNLKHAVADIKKMLNYAKDASVRINERDIAWKILLFRGAWLEEVYKQPVIPDEFWSAETVIGTESVSKNNASYSDILIAKATLPDFYKSPYRNIQPRISTASKQKHIDVVSEESFWASIIAGDDILDAVCIACVTGGCVYIYPDVQNISVSVVSPVVPASVDAFGWDTDLNMSPQALRDAILEILTKDFQLNAAAVSDIVSDMKDQLMILNQGKK